MKIAGVPYRSIWRDADGVAIIDQTCLPFEFCTLHLSTCEQVAHAIRSMQVRGAPLIGASAAYGIALAMAEEASDENLRQAARMLESTRPTAVNLRWAVARMTGQLHPVSPAGRIEAAWAAAEQIAQEDVTTNSAIGRYGLELLRDIARRKGRVDVLTHCNAGWLATVDVGTALAPIYLAHDAGLPVHVWVDETRPRNQGLLTAWELSQHGVPNTLIADNAGGHLMQAGKVDLVLVGADRVTAAGDVCNKIGTYLKALAAKDCDVAFYAAVPSPTIDWNITDASQEIPIEQRGAEEILMIRGLATNKAITSVQIAPDATRAANPAFDITPARLVTGIITERGIAAASSGGLKGLYPRKVA